MKPRRLKGLALAAIVFALGIFAGEVGMNDQPDVAFLIVAALLFLPLAVKPQLGVSFLYWVHRHRRPRPPTKLGISIMQGSAIFGLGTALHQLAVAGFNAAGFKVRNRPFRSCQPQQESGIRRTFS